MNADAANRYTGFHMTRQYPEWVRRSSMVERHGLAAVVPILASAEPAEALAKAGEKRSTTTVEACKVAISGRLPQNFPIGAFGD